MRESNFLKPKPPPLQIAKPCPKQWGEMAGDTKRRFCEHCDFHVHNLSAMLPPELKRFVAESGGKACIAYELRPDGSMVTQSGWSWLVAPFRRVQWSIPALLAAVFPFFFSACETRRTLGKPAHSCDTSARGKSLDLNTVTLGTPMPPSASQERH